MNGLRAEYVDHMGDDLAVVNAARVSFAKEVEEFRDRDAGLIRFLAREGHWTPFAHTSIKLRMKAPVPIRTQCFKHKSGFVENEESRRYISVEPEVFFPDWRYAAADKKQGSGGHMVGHERGFVVAAYHQSVNQAVKTYSDLLDAGACEEQARFVLPQGCVVNWMWTGNVASFARFHGLRSDSHAQGESSVLASEVARIIEPLFPVSWASLTGAA